MNTHLRVAVVGTGRMGAAMTGRLRGAGFPVVIFNRTRARAEAVAEKTGAMVAPSPREAVSGADVVLNSLADDAAVRAVYKGRDGICAGLRPGAAVLEASTVSPETISAMNVLVQARDATLLDTPVSGSVSVVETGRIMVMAGGDEPTLERSRSVLDSFAAKVIHVGPQGSGATIKLVVNSIVHALNQALSESLVFAERAGIPREGAYEVFANSAIAAPFVHYKRAAFEHPENAEVAFMLDLVAKDLALAADLATDIGARMDQLAVNRRIVNEAQAAGYGERDISAVASYLRGSPPP